MLLKDYNTKDFKSEIMKGNLSELWKDKRFKYEKDLIVQIVKKKDKRFYNSHTTRRKSYIFLIAMTSM